MRASKRRNWLDCWLDPAARKRHGLWRCHSPRASRGPFASDAKASDSRRLRVVARLSRARALRVLSLRCSGRLFAALARDAPTVGARGVSIGSPTWSERSSCFHQKCCESRRRAARGDISSSFEFFVSACFLHFSVFSVGGMSIHSNFSTSAAICAIGERGDNRNRVTGEECTLILTRFGCED